MYPYGQQASADGFDHLTVTGFRQFGLVDIDLSQPVTILTGVNGAGKTSLLNILGLHFNWFQQFLASPTKIGAGNIDVKPLQKLLEEEIFYSATLSPKEFRRLVQLRREVLYPDQPGRPPSQGIGQLRYSNIDSPSSLSIPHDIYGLEYTVMIEPQM